MSYAIRVRVEAKLDGSATILWVAALIVAALLTWWDQAESGPADPANPDDLVWIDLESE